MARAPTSLFKNSAVCIRMDLLALSLANLSRGGACLDIVNFFRLNDRFMSKI